MVESVFAQAQRVATDGEALLVDHDQQRAELEPERLAVASPTDRRVASVVELVPCRGHHGTPEAQQSLFTWAEFIARAPGLTKRLGRKAPSASRSQFDWELEQEQHARLVANTRYADSESSSRLAMTLPAAAYMWSAFFLPARTRDQRRISLHSGRFVTSCAAHWRWRAQGDICGDDRCVWRRYLFDVTTPCLPFRSLRRREPEQPCARRRAGRPARCWRLARAARLPFHRWARSCSSRRCALRRTSPPCPFLRHEARRPRPTIADLRPI